MSEDTSSDPHKARQKHDTHVSYRQPVNEPAQDADIDLNFLLASTSFDNFVSSFQQENIEETSPTRLSCSLTDTTTGSFAGLLNQSSQGIINDSLDSDCDALQALLESGCPTFDLDNYGDILTRRQDSGQVSVGNIGTPARQNLALSLATSNQGRESPFPPSLETRTAPTYPLPFQSNVLTDEEFAQWLWNSTVSLRDEPFSSPKESVTSTHAANWIDQTPKTDPSSSALVQATRAASSPFVYSTTTFGDLDEAQQLVCCPTISTVNTASGLWQSTRSSTGSGGTGTLARQRTSGGVHENAVFQNFCESITRPTTEESLMSSVGPDSKLTRGSVEPVQTERNTFVSRSACNRPQYIPYPDVITGRRTDRGSGDCDAMEHQPISNFEPFRGIDETVRLYSGRSIPNSCEHDSGCNAPQTSQSGIDDLQDAESQKDTMQRRQTLVDSARDPFRIIDNCDNTFSSRMPQIEFLYTTSQRRPVGASASRIMGQTTDNYDHADLQESSLGMLSRRKRSERTAEDVAEDCPDAGAPDFIMPPRRKVARGQDRTQNPALPCVPPCHRPQGSTDNILTKDESDSMMDLSSWTAPGFVASKRIKETARQISDDGLPCCEVRTKRRVSTPHNAERQSVAVASSPSSQAISKHPPTDVNAESVSKGGKMMMHGSRPSIKIGQMGWLDAQGKAVSARSIRKILRTRPRFSPHHVFRCPMPSCDKSFTAKSRHFHLRVHFEKLGYLDEGFNRPFNCPRCKRPFPDLSALRRHIYDCHLKMRQVICTSCGTILTRGTLHDQLQRHLGSGKHRGTRERLGLRWGVIDTSTMMTSDESGGDEDVEYRAEDEEVEDEEDVSHDVENAEGESDGLSRRGL